MNDFLEDMFRGHTVLNLCSGKSLIGNIRVDNDTSLNEPTMYADMFKILQEGYFKDNMFDFVYADPLFGSNGTNFYNPRSGYIVEKAKELGYTENFGRLAFDWQKLAYKIAKIALVTRRDRTNINLDSNYTEYFVVWDSRPSVQLLRFDWKRHPI